MSGRLNIVSVCRSFPTPADPSSGVFVLNRVAAMAAQSDLTVIQPVPYFPSVRPLPGWAQSPVHVASGMRIHHAPMFYVPGILKSLDATWLARSIEAMIARWHKERPIEVIDAHFGYPEGAACVAVGRCLDIPVFVTVRGFENEYFQQPLIGSRMLKSLREATGIVAVSHSLARVLEQHGISSNRIRVVHNAIDREVFNYGEASQARQRLSFEPKAPLIVSVGHLVSRKRHHVLIEALARAGERLREATLVIIGSKSFERSYPDELSAKAVALGVADRVRFIGNIAPERVVDWLRAGDVFALGTAREGCCNAVLEALAVGAPVVTTPAGDNAQFVRPHNNGLLVPIDDADALSAALIAALEPNRWDRQRISADLHAQVGNWPAVASRVLDFFSARLNKPSALQGFPAST